MSAFRFLKFPAIRNLPISVKAFAASAVLLVSLVGLGADAYLTLDRSSDGLKRLNDSTLPKQEIILRLTSEITQSHINLFRYTAWSSNGVSQKLLARLSFEVFVGMSQVTEQIGTLVRREDLTPAEGVEVRQLAEKWRKFSTAIRDTVDVGRTDPAMATMMLGGTDDDYQAVAYHLQQLSLLSAIQTRGTAESLSAEADRNKNLLSIGALIGILLSLITTLLVSRSLVKPVRAVTRALKQISFGDLEINLDKQYSDRRDEIGQMVEAIITFCDDMRRDKDMLDRQAKKLQDQNLRFNAALTNMSQGLAMFDANRRLIVCNKRFGEVYGLPRHLLEPGTAQKDIIENGVVARASPHFDIDSFRERRLGDGGAQDQSDMLVELDDGRVISVSHRPMPDGGWVSTHEDITERRRAEARIAHMARHDVLTELPNRLLFKDRLDQAVRRAHRGIKSAVLYLDLDRFKPVNDTLGHPVGDTLLRSVAERLQEAVRETDTVARLSGDEFAILMDGIDSPDDASILAERLLEVISKPFLLKGQQVVIGTSIGVALAPQDGTDADALLHNADVALYRAKGEGRNRYKFFESEMDAKLQSRRKMEFELRHALENDEFEVHYQPIVNVQKGEISGFEALLRWKHERLGLVSPTVFIPLAEEIGLINAIGDWVLNRACAEAAGWPGNLRVAVNLSPVQFVNVGLEASVTGALKAAGLVPSRLELEITESVLLLDNAKTHAALHKMRKLGVRISMDDFGTGYSSLSYLRSFPFDKIKIDRSFVKDLPDSPDCAAIVRAVTGLAGSLGVVITAEGVETKEQLDHLRREGCGEIQGFYFGRPMPAAKVPEFLATWPERSKAA